MKGNRRRGDGRCVPGENLLDLSRNIKPAGCHPQLSSYYRNRYEGERFG